MKIPRGSVVAWLVLATTIAARAEEIVGPKISGEVDFVVTDAEAKVAELFRLTAHKFSYQQRPLATTSRRMELFEVTFPSAVVTSHPNNNTVHAEYFRPLGDIDQRRPGVVVLHILGGDFALSRLFCRQLADKGVAALFVKLPYYGPRRQPGVSARMVSDDPRQTAAGMRQAVLDVRRAIAWLGAQGEIDAERLGVFGISLGGITSALAATAEPRIVSACLMLAGGDVAEVSWNSRHLVRIREKWLASGGTKEEFFDALSSVDPVTYAAAARDRRILMLNATRDEIIPRRCTESLWRALGEPEIVWLDAGHYSAALHVAYGLDRVSKFFCEKDWSRNPRPMTDQTGADVQDFGDGPPIADDGAGEPSADDR